MSNFDSIQLFLGSFKEIYEMKQLCVGALRLYCLFGNITDL